MRIKTDTPVVKKAREGVMEFLLVSTSGVSGDVLTPILRKNSDGPSQQ
jgi:hypothetical protein